MALNIPLPGVMGDTFGKALDQGGALFSRIMEPHLKREELAQHKALQEAQMAQQKQLHDAQLAQQWKTHIDNMMIQKLTQGRLGQAASDAHKLMQMKLDPDYEVNQIKRLMSLAGGGKVNPTEQESYMPSIGGQLGNQGGDENAMPQQQEQIPQLNEQAINPYNAERQSQNGGLNIETMKNAPWWLRGAFKKHGIDFGATEKETPEQKNAAAINKAVTIDEAKANRKKIDEIEKTAQALLPYLGKVNTIEDILKRKPELTGVTTKLADVLGMTKDEDVGKFLSAAQTLQAHMAKEMSTRGGYGVSKLVEQAKPNISKSPSYNKGVIKELKQGMRDSFDLMKKEYERLSPGKKFPYDFEEYFKEQMGTEPVPIISPNGKRVMIPADQVEAALAAGGRHA